MYMCKCNICAALAACKHTFGKYWADKSHGGKGCDAPLAPGHAEAVAAAIEKAEAAKVQDDLFAAKAEAECKYAEREWIVVHMCREYPTTAKTAAGAINNIRFKLYGTRPMRSLPPFAAKPKRIGNLSAAAAVARLKRLVG